MRLTILLGMLFISILIAGAFWLPKKAHEVVGERIPAEAGSMEPDPIDAKPHTFPFIPYASLKRDGIEHVFYDVVRVVDGDTIVVRMGNKDEKVRFVGVDTPESVDPRKKVECFGREAAAYTKLLLEGRSVALYRDTTQDDRDTYGRLLRLVVRDDGLFVNETLVREGYGHEYTYRIPHTYKDAFEAAERFAEKDARGLWGEACNEV
jgi:micrococcal nuclease